VTTHLEPAVMTMLEEAGEPLHWTVIQDRLLKTGAIDPFTTPDVRGLVARTLRDLTDRGSLTRVGTGVYRVARTVPGSLGEP
jgi:predicted transcriptional regulator of viral defense system